MLQLLSQMLHPRVDGVEGFEEPGKTLLGGLAPLLLDPQMALTVSLQLLTAVTKPRSKDEGGRGERDETRE